MEALNFRTMVQLVVDRERSAETSRRPQGGYERLNIVADICAVVTILAGIAIYICNTGTKFSSYITASYQTILFVTSTIFLVYLEVFHLHEKFRRPQQLPRRRSRTYTGDIILHERQMITTPAPSLPQTAASSVRLPPCHLDVDNDLPSTSSQRLTSSESKTNHDAVAKHDPVSFNKAKHDNVAVFRRRGSFSTQSDDAIDYEERIQKFLITNSETATLADDGSSFFLRCGAVLLGACNMVYVMLHLEDLMGGHIPDHRKQDIAPVWPHFFHLIFLLVQSYFIFKHSQIFVKVHKPFVRWGCLHVMSCNICTWLETLIVQVAIVAKTDINTTEGASCVINQTAFQQALPFLFPCVWEYSLLSAGIFVSMSGNVYIKITRALLKKIRDYLQVQRTTVLTDYYKHKTSGIVLEKSHRGLFLGMVFVSVVLISILLYYLISRRKAMLNYQWIHVGARLALEVCMLVGIIVVIFTLMKLGYKECCSIDIDYWILTLSMSGKILFDILSIICNITRLAAKMWPPAISYLITELISIFVSMFYTTAQTGIIITSFYRQCKTEDQFRKKPGRAAVTFLIIGNVALWLFHSFLYRGLLDGHQNDFFGPIMWQCIVCIFFPLHLSYHFHSSVCLSEIWFTAYSRQVA